MTTAGYLMTLQRCTVLSHQNKGSFSLSKYLRLIAT